jgi:hypothetical protein
MVEGKAIWVTIRLRPETASMVTQCMDTGAFSSMSDFFESVLLVFHEHSQALLHYIEQEEAKGITHDAIFGMLNSDITFRRLDSQVLLCCCGETVSPCRIDRLLGVFRCWVLTTAGAASVLSETRRRAVE